MTDEKPLQPEELGDLYVLYLRASPEQRAAIRGTEAGLDVERLTRAMHSVAHPDHPLDGPDGDWCRDDVMDDAIALAAEYARLASADDR